MAIPWPQGADWPIELHEHATELTKYLGDTLDCIDRSQDQHVPANLVRTMITGTLTMISKTLRTPDLNLIQDTLSIMQTEEDRMARVTRMNLRRRYPRTEGITIYRKTQVESRSRSSLADKPVVHPEIYPAAWGEGVGGKLRDIDFKIIKSDGQGSYC